MLESARRVAPGSGGVQRVGWAFALLWWPSIDVGGCALDAIEGALGGFGSGRRRPNVGNGAERSVRGEVRSAWGGRRTVSSGTTLALTLAYRRCPPFGSLCPFRTERPTGRSFLRMPTLDPTERLARWSLATGIAVLLLKSIAWRLTGSVALLSDALESIVNVVASFAMLYAVRIARIPADQNHPYGHGKAEYLSAVLEGVLIAVAAVLSIHAAWDRLFHPRALDAIGAGIAFSFVATALNGLLAWRLMTTGKKLRSPALAADGRHILSDVVTSVGVLVGIGLAQATGWWVLDPLLACLVAVNILWMGWKLIRLSIGGLMDEVLDPAELERWRAIADRVAREGGAVGVEQFRLRRTGTSAQCDLILRVPGEMEVRAAHAICDRIEAALQVEDADVGVVVHVEPSASSTPAI